MSNNFSESLNKIQNIEEKLNSFLSSFELVFDHDWDMSRSVILDDNFISENGTFLNPQVDDESNNWANRGSLLESYRRLKDELESETNNE